MRQLVLYYGDRDKAEQLGQALGAKLKCDLEKVIETTPPQGLWRWLKGWLAARAKQLTNIAPIKSNLIYYDIIILVTPCWAGTLPPATRTLLQQYQGQLKKLAVVALAGLGLDKDKLLTELESISGQRIEHKLIIREQRLEQITASNQFKDFTSLLLSLKNVKGDLATP